MKIHRILHLLFCLPLLLNAQQRLTPAAAVASPLANVASTQECVRLELSILESKVPAYLQMQSEVERAMGAFKAVIARCEQSGEDPSDDCTITVAAAAKQLLQAQKKEQAIHNALGRIVQVCSNIPLRSERLKQAMKAVQNGDLRRADRILQTQEITVSGDALMRQRSTDAKNQIRIDSLLEPRANEFMFKALLKAADFEDPLRLDSLDLHIANSLRYSDIASNQVIFGLLMADNGKYEAAIRFHEQARSRTSTMQERALSQIAWNLALFHAERGNISAAEEQHRLAKDGLETLVRSHPKERESTLVTFTLGLADFYEAAGRRPEAQEMLQQSLALFTQLVADDSLYALDLSRIQMQLGRLAMANQDFDTAKQLLEAAWEIQAQCLGYPESDCEQYRAQSTGLMGELQAQLKQFKTATNAYSRCVDSYGRLSNGNPKLFEPKISAALTQLALAQEKNGDDEDAESTHKLAIQRSERMKDNDPLIFGAAWVMAQMNLGDFYYRDSQYEEALIAYEHAWVGCRWLCNIEPTPFGAEWMASAQNYSNVCMILQKLDRVEGILKAVLANGEQLMKIDPQQHEFLFAQAQTQLGIYYGSKLQFEEGAKAIEPALKIFRRLAEGDPEKYEKDLAWVAASLGTCKSHIHAIAEAKELLELAYDIHSRLADRFPRQYESMLATTMVNLADLCDSLGQPDLAETYYQRTLEIHLRLAQKYPATYKIELARTHNSYGAHCLTHSQFEQARQSFSLSLARIQEVVLSGQAHQFWLFQYPYKNLAQLKDSLQLRRDWTTSLAIQEEKVAAIAAMKAVVENLETKHVDALGTLSWDYLFTRQYEESREAAEMALEMNPASNWIRTNLGHSYLFSGDWDNATRIYQEYIDNMEDREEGKKILNEDWNTFESSKILNGKGKKAIRRAREWLNG